MLLLLSRTRFNVKYAYRVSLVAPEMLVLREKLDPL